MKSLNIYKIFLISIICTFSGCKTKTYINEKVTPDNDGTRTIELDLKKLIEEKRTGIYIYPNLGTTISLKKGKFNGVFQIIDKKDTIFYCNYIDNLPVGQYIKNFHHQYIYRHYRTLPLKPKIDFNNGKGFFNNQHQKEGFWLEYDRNCTGKGTYQKGKKEGIWEEKCFEDVGGNYTTKILTYKNDSLLKK
jgi:hypothetical protein